MTTFDFSAFTTSFDMTVDQNSDAAAMQGTGSDGNGSYVQWRSTFFVPIRAYSDDVAVNGSNVPISGTFTSIRMFLGADVLELSDLSIAATDFSYTSGVAAADQFWAQLLQGESNIILNAAFGVTAFGDQRVLTSGTLDCSNDTFTGTSSGNSDLHGDTRSVTDAQLNGGDDVFNVTSRETYGDTETITNATVFGGDDTIIFTGDFPQTRLFVFGEGDIVTSSNVFAGDDIIDVSLVTSTTSENVICGDAFNVGGVSTFEGGDDVITGSQAVDTIYGDLNSISTGGVLTGGNDTINAGGGNDQVFGDVDESRSNGTFTGGNDVIDGGTGNDKLNGNGGDDIIIGGEGNDEINGGGGSDTASYVGALGGVTVSLLLQNAQQDTSGAGLDTLTLVENLVGSSHIDTLTGDDGVNRLSGGNGSDILIGGSGNDVLTGGTGGDVLDGGIGKDAANYSGSAVGVDVNLRNDNATGGDANGDTFSRIEDLVGSVHNDRLAGDGGSNALDGGDGSDRLNGANGNDTLVGGLGSDVLTGGLGQDDMSGGGGKDRFDFDSTADAGITAATRDIIQDFTVINAGTSAFIDRIDLSGIDAKAGTAGNDAFVFIGAAAFTAEGQVRAVQVGANTEIRLNTTGVDTAEMIIVLKDFTAVSLDNVDFIL